MPAGNPGPTGQALIDQGFRVDSYEPYRAACAPPSGKYDLIVCVEVLELCQDLKGVAARLREYVCRDGIIWIETLLHPHPAPPDVLNSWYIAPRDGHVSIHTFWSLTLLFTSVGMKCVQTAVGTFAFDQVTSFTNRIFPGA